MAGLKREIKAVEIRAEVRQLKTMADGTINLTLNLPEDCKEQAKKMLDWLGLELFVILSTVRINGGITE